jgi:hypothetical protein
MTKPYTIHVDVGDNIWYLYKFLYGLTSLRKRDEVWFECC